VETKGKILFVEEANEAPYRVDRMLRQLAMAGKFTGVAGVLVGRFSGVTRTERRRCEDLVLEAVGDRAVPVAAGFPAGHGPGNAVFPIGVPAVLDGASGLMEFSPFLEGGPN
jgi:muramoyltetrapeptide carboxypeptidase